MKKKILAVLLTVAMIAGLLCVPAMAADEGTFNDVPEDYWAAEAIDRWAGYGVLQGNGNGTFNPEGQMNRAQFAAMMVKLLGLTETSDKTFSDVTGDYAWAAVDVDKAATAGIIQGQGGDKFAPGKPVTFNAAAVMLSRALGLVTMEESSGTNYADKTVETLTKLDMLDDVVNASVAAEDFNRAMVATLASNMIEVYANDPEKATTVEGQEIKGVVLAVKGASVELVNCEVAAPIVVDSASVTLTGTTAANVVVTGTDAAITADADSKVETVSISATDAAVELNGDVGAIVVEEAAAGDIEIKGDGVTEDVVDNSKATVDVTVNDETVAKPAEEDPNKPGEDEPSGYVPGPTVVETPPAAESAPPEVTSADKAPAAGTAGTTVPGKEEDGTTDKVLCTAKTPAEEHTWGVLSVTGEGLMAATCETEGKGTYTCSKCGAVNTVTIPALGHNWYKKAVVNATCADNNPGKITWACANSAECKKFPASGSGENAVAATNDEPLAKLAHTRMAVPYVAPTCKVAGRSAGIACSACSPKEGDVYTSYTWLDGKTAEQHVVAATGKHVDKVTKESVGANVTAQTADGKCDVCGDAMPVDPSSAPTTSPEPTASPDPTESPSVEPTEAPHTHTAADNAEWVNTDATNHWKVCKDNDEGKVGEEAHKSWEPNNATTSDGKTKCGVCGYAKTCPGHTYGNDDKCTLCGTAQVHTLTYTQSDNSGTKQHTATACSCGKGCAALTAAKTAANCTSNGDATTPKCTVCNGSMGD